MRPSYAEEAQEFAREIQRNLGLEPMDDPFPETVEQLTPPQEYEASMRAACRPWQKNFTSDDYSDYTWHAPTVRCLHRAAGAAPPHRRLRVSGLGLQRHGRAARRSIDPGMFLAGKTIAAHAPRSADAAARSWRRRRPSSTSAPAAASAAAMGGAAAAARFQPPIDLRWPEYVDDRARRGMVDPHAGRRVPASASPRSSRDGEDGEGSRPVSCQHRA